nr:MAG TPA: hypothetical protein [Caudoviricetes sp.]
MWDNNTTNRKKNVCTVKIIAYFGKIETTKGGRAYENSHM